MFYVRQILFYLPQIYSQIRLCMQNILTFFISYYLITTVINGISDQNTIIKIFYLHKSPPNYTEIGTQKTLCVRTIFFCIFEPNWSIVFILELLLVQSCQRSNFQLLLDQLPEGSDHYCGVTDTEKVFHTCIDITKDILPPDYHQV